MLATTTINHPFDLEDQLRKVCLAYNTCTLLLYMYNNVNHIQLFKKVGFEPNTTHGPKKFGSQIIFKLHKQQSEIHSKWALNRTINKNKEIGCSGHWYKTFHIISNVIETYKTVNQLSLFQHKKNL